MSLVSALFASRSRGCASPPCSVRSIPFHDNVGVGWQTDFPTSRSEHHHVPLDLHALDERKGGQRHGEVQIFGHEQSVANPHLVRAKVRSLDGHVTHCHAVVAREARQCASDPRATVPIVSDPTARVLPALPTGLDDLDDLTGGGNPGEVWVVSGPPRVGASLLALGMARAVTRFAHRQVTWLSTWEEPPYLRERLLTAEGGWLNARARTGLLAEDDEARWLWLKADVASLPLTVLRADPSDLLDQVRRLVRSDTPAALVLDRVEAAAAAAVLPDLKALAQSSDTWIVVVIGDENRGRDAVRTSTEHLAGLLVWVEREDLYQPDSDRIGEADLFVHRQGRVTEATVAHQARYQRFINMWRLPAYGGGSPY